MCTIEYVIIGTRAAIRARSTGLAQAAAKTNPAAVAIAVRALV